MFWCWLVIMIVMSTVFVWITILNMVVWWKNELPYEQDRLLLLSIMVLAIVATFFLGLPLVGQRVLVPVTRQEAKMLEEVRNGHL